MQWIFDNLQVLVLVAFVIGPLIKQIADAAKTKRKEQRERDYGGDPHDTDASGEPEPRWIPIPIPPEFRPPPTPVMVQPPPLRTHSEDPDGALLRQQLEMQEKALESRKQARQASDKALQKTLELERRARTAVREKSDNRLRSSIRTQLKRPSSARAAILLREILDRPVGMR